MKRLSLCLLALLLALALPLSGAARAEEAAPGPFLLVSVYRNFAWGARFFFGALDDGGRIWVRDGVPPLNCRRTPRARRARWRGAACSPAWARSMKRCWRKSAAWPRR